MWSIRVMGSIFDLVINVNKKKWIIFLYFLYFFGKNIFVNICSWIKKKYWLNYNNLVVYFCNLFKCVFNFSNIFFKIITWIKFCTNICISCVIFNVNVLMHLLRWLCPFSQQISANSFLFAKMAQSKISEIFTSFESCPTKIQT